MDRNYARTMMCSLVVAGLALGLALPRAAGEEEESGPGGPGLLVTVGGWAAKDYLEGIGDVVVPLYYHGQGLLFINPRLSFTDQRAREYNLGVGYRRLVWEKALMGANMYYDRRHTALGASFNQVGFGAEYLGPIVDARANVYLPLESRELVGSYATEEQSVSRRRSTALHASWDDPHPVGHDIYQDFEVELVTDTRTTTTTTTRHYHQYEVPMRGWDAEIGARIPIKPIDPYVRLKPFAGYYRYEGRHGIDSIQGFRGRLEVHVKPAFLIDAVYYTDDALTGGHYAVGVYASIPFDVSALADRRSPFAWALERWDAAGRRQGDMRYRLTDRVLRDPQIRSSLGEPEEQTGQTVTTTRSTTRATREIVAEGTAEVATDITFVDGNRGNDLNPGTFEEPKQTIQAGVDDPRSMVFVFDTGGVYEEQVAITQSVNLRGEGFPLPAHNGMVYGSGVHPVVDANQQGPTFTLSQANTSITGLEITSSTGSGGIESTTGEHLLIAHNRFHNTWRGVNVQASFGRDIHVTLEDNVFFNNQDAGAAIQGTAYPGPLDYFVYARNNTFVGGMHGLLLTGDGFDSAMIILQDIDVSGASSAGIRANLDRAESLAVLAMGNIRAENNANGIMGRVNSAGTALLLGGMPEPLMQGVGEVLGGMAGPLPLEAQALLSVSGPILANNNGLGLGLVAEGRDFAGLLLLDAQASRCAGSGANISVSSEEGVALGLVGSSENLMEVAQLGMNVLNLLPLGLPPLPELPPSPMGPARFNDNEFGGLSLNVNGKQGAVAALLGVEANRTEFFNAITLNSTSSEGFAAALLGRIEANHNTRGIGISAMVEGNTLGLGALVDFHASHNAIGVNFGVAGDVAFGLLGSTDPLRSVAEVLNTELGLDPPLVIPGAPFGPSVASHNSLHGILTGVTGRDMALGVHLDIHAQNNTLYGIQSQVVSSNGEAFGFFGSSDMLFEALPPLLGEVLNGEADGIPAPAYTPMGDMLVTGNRSGGLRAVVKGHWDANVLAGGITASDNLAVGGPGHGVSLQAEAEQGDASAALMNVTAMGNAGHGIDVAATAEDQASVALLRSRADNNDGSGMALDVQSATDDVFVILAGADAAGNALHGVDLTAAAGQDLGVALTATDASGNLGHGLRLDGTADGDVLSVWVGAQAIEGLRDEFGDYDLFGASEALRGMLPVGPSVFNGNAGDGLHLNLDNAAAPGAEALIRVDVNESEALNNTGVDVYGRLYRSEFGGTSVDYTNFLFGTEDIQVIAP